MGSPSSVVSPKAPSHLWIATLGDSYTAGDGAGANYNGCDDSYNSYPWLYMNLLRGHGYSADIWQAACSGAVTTQISGQINDLRQSPAGDKANIVFLTIGGNDLGFSGIVKECLLPLLSYATKNPCSTDLSNGEALFDATIAKTKTDLKQIHGAMPHAQIVLLGYPLLTSPICPHVGSTTVNSRISSDQVQYESQQQAMVSDLNSETGNYFHFVSVEQLFDGHGPCASQADQWVNGLEFSALTSSAGISAQTGAYHPKEIGDENIANQLFYSNQVQSWITGT